MDETIAMLRRLIAWNLGMQRTSVTTVPLTNEEAATRETAIVAYGRAARDLNAVLNTLTSEEG